VFSHFSCQESLERCQERCVSFLDVSYVPNLFVPPAAKKVGRFIKKNAGKIAKFGLKIYATATKIGSRLANFIPGVGKAISKGLDGVSRVANKISDKIPVSLGKKLERGVRVMNTIQNPISEYSLMPRNRISTDIWGRV